MSSKRQKVKNGILLYFHCRRCLEELPSGTSPKDYQQIQVGWTERGLQIWCIRHNMNVVSIDFEGAKHPAVTTTFVFTSLPLEEPKP